MYIHTYIYIHLYIYCNTDQQFDLYCGIFITDQTWRVVLLTKILSDAYCCVWKSRTCRGISMALSLWKQDQWSV